MLMQFPTKGSLDKWVSLTGDSSWSFNALQKYYKRAFSFTPPKHELRQEIPAAEYQASDWGSDTTPLIHVSYPNTPSNYSHFMQLSCNEKGEATVMADKG